MFRKVTLCLICVLLQGERPWRYFRLSSWVSDHSFLLNIFLGLSLTSSFPNFSPRCVYPTGFLCVNDASISRTSRLRKVLHSYVPKQFLTDERVRITSFDGTTWGEIEKNTFDRVRPHHQNKHLFWPFGNSWPDQVLLFLSSGPCWCSVHHRPAFTYGGWQQYIQ